MARSAALPIGALATALVATLAAPAAAGEIQVDAGLQLAASTWREDYGGGTSFRLGYRFAKVVAIDALVTESLMSVDTRLDTGLTLGVTGSLPMELVRPQLRAFVMHQHEESLVSVADSPAGVVFGIGAGIRHRAGGGGALGLEIPFAANDDLEAYVRPAATFAILSEDEIGPQAYFSLGASVGLSFLLEKLP